MRMPLAVRRLVERPDVTIVHEFRPPPYGGSNQFLLALRGELERRGLRVSADTVAARTRACLVHAWLVDVPALQAQLHPGCRVVHRVDGPVALYRGHDDGADERVLEVNRALAEVTILQSRFSLEAHARLGLELRNPVVIPNAVDATIFYPAIRDVPGTRVRLIATSWSDNPKKGGETLAALARTLDPERYELTFVGRTPVDLGPARVVPPVGSTEVGELLRGHDVYLAPSLDDPCSNALLEALACGLPAVYARSGGHPELVGEGGLGYDDPDEIPALLEQLRVEWADRRAAIAVTPLAEVVDRYLETMGLA